MTGNAIPEALKPFAKIAEFFADEQEWRDHDTIMVAPMENLREAQHLTVGGLRRARTAYDAAVSAVKALEWSEAGGATALGLSYDVWLTKDAAQGYREIWLAALMQGGRESIGTFSSKEKAQAACQADFERRVLSCLSPVAVEEADAKAERKGHTPSDEEMDEATIRQRDIAEDAADKLAEAIGELLGVNVGEHSSAHSPWETALEHAGQAVRNRALSTYTAAGAGPVGEAVADEGWQPIETAPTGGKFGCFLMLAFGPPGDQTVSEGMHFQGRFYAASVFYTGGPHDTKQFTFREHEVKPTHWRHTLAAPGTARPVEEPAGPVGEAVADAEAERLHEAWGEFETDYDLVREGHPHIHYRQCRAAFESAWPDAKKATANAAALLAARPIEEPGEAVAWRDMTSAPKDGTVIWLYQPHDVGGFMFAGAINADGVWINNLDLKVQDPTHWMPLPANPGSVRPAEEPGEVERLRAEGFALAANQCRYGYGDEHGHHRCAEIDRLTREIFFAKSALAEARGLIRDAIGLVPLAHQNWHTDARAALTGDAQEAGR